MTIYANAPAPNLPYFTPAQTPPSGTAFDPQPDGKAIPKLFQPLKIRGVEFHNRIFVCRTADPLSSYYLTPRHNIAITVMSVLRRRRETDGMAYSTL